MEAGAHPVPNLLTRGLSTMAAVVQSVWPSRKTLASIGTPLPDKVPPSLPQPLGIHDLLNLQIPARQMLLDPILPERGLMMLHAPRGIGKTFLSISIGLAVAGSLELLGWKTLAPRKVLYIDGEMPVADLKSRIELLSGGMGKTISNDHFRLLAADHIDGGIPNLATIEGQLAIEAHLDGVSLVIVDNISTLFQTGSENGGDSWVPIQNWLLKLRRMGKSVLLVHHTGKNGNQRGTSRREDVLDTVVGLRRPPDYEPSQGARVEIHFEKCRSFAGDAAGEFEARLATETSGERAGKLRWSRHALSPDIQLAEIAALFREGRSVRAVADELGMSRSTVGRLRQEAGELGLLTVSPK